MSRIILPVILSFHDPLCCSRQLKEIAPFISLREWQRNIGDLCVESRVAYFTKASPSGVRLQAKY